jgi:hypothetical protein
MTLTAGNRVRYNGDDVTISFPITFVFWKPDDPQATLADVDGVETTWIRGTHYTISGGSGSSGTLTVITLPTDYTPATGETLTIKSDLANTQPSKFPLGGPFPSVAVELQLDQIVRQIQQISEEISRSIQLKISSSESDIFIDDLLGNAAKFLRVKTAEEGIELAAVVPSGSIGVPVAVNEGGTAATTAAIALTNLGAAGTGITNTFIKNQVWNKGADLTSATPLVLGSDGNFWDVAGTIGFSQITCTAGTLFMLQFDDALIMTDGANLDLGGTNITTATGDRGLFFAIAADTAILLTFKHESQRRVINSHAKIGATAGWAVNTTDDIGLLATCPASQTNSTLVVPVSGLKVGDKITSFSIVGQIESGGNAVTLDANLRKMTAATSDVTDASVGSITQISVTADAIISAEKTGLTEVVGANETFYILLTATTLGSTDIALQGATITVSEG